MYRLEHALSRRRRARLAAALIVALPGAVAATPPLVSSPAGVEVRDDDAPASARALSFAGGLGVGVGVAGVFGRDHVRERVIQCPAPAPPTPAESVLPPGWSDALWQVNDNGQRIARNRRDIDLLRDSVQAVVPVVPDLSDVVRFDKDATVHLRGARLIALGEGDVGPDSRHAVNGTQLYATEKRVAALEYTQLYARVGADDESFPAYAGHLSTALGSDARAEASGSTAIGSYATARGSNSVALGRAAIILEGAHDGFALGSRSRVLAENGMAIGASTQVWEGAHDSVALGFGSIVQRPFEVSVGGQGIRRRITNAMPGIAPDDVVSLRQLSELAGVIGTGVNAEGGVRGLRFAVQGRYHGTVSSALDALDYAVSAAHDRMGGIDQQVSALAAQQGSDGQGSADVEAAPMLTASVEATADADREGAFAADAPAPAPAAAPAEAGARGAQQAQAPLPPVDTRAVDDAVQRANAYTDQAMAGVDRRFDRIDRRMNRMAAMGSAQAAMAMNTAGLPTWNRLGAGVGHADGESALAVGYQRVLDRRATTTFSLNGAFSQGGESTVAVGVGIGW
ncbi:YadA-like family protein [Stenotrophomonas aracearum]|jgi:autotransporter adhesin|uniref:YadA-like family protein n=1 Tax=Stenotrophomonas aracearum TaxID=3003272 RepID=A0ABY9YBF8_9GAMM|nr:YadA-like family protein [Stenotrophomonas sp. A5588]WNH48015.1 YadA-like family protein [Stenotrophomonas sp. A5588]